MDNTALVEPEIATGRDVTEALDQAGVSVPAVFWFYLLDAEEWRLIIATPLVDTEGPKKAYANLQRVLSKRQPPLNIDLRRISLVSPRDPLIQLLRRALKTGPQISGIRFRQNAINNVFIEDAYIYRLL